MRNWIVIIFLLISFATNAAELFKVSSPRQIAMGDVPALQTGIWSVFDNPAGGSKPGQWEAGMLHHSLYRGTGLSAQAGAITYGTRLGVFGVGVATFGYPAFRQNRYAINYSIALARHLSAGVRFNYAEWRASEGYGRASMLYAEVGVLYKTDEGLSAGVYYFNPYAVPVSGDFDVETSTGVRGGVSYTVAGATIAAGASKNAIDPLEASAGVEIPVLKVVYIRGGIGLTEPDYSLGTGVKVRHLAIDAAIRHHVVLGYSPMFSLQAFF